MAEGSSSSSAAKGTDAAGSISVVETLFQRRIEFHPARKQASSFPVSDGGFRLESLNPNSGPVRPVASSGGAVTAAASQGNHLVEAEFYEHGLDPELSCRITFRRIGAGLANLGNTCFLNSVLQCLTYTEPFAAYLQSGKHKSSCHTAGFCAICALQNHVITALQSSGKILSPAHLVKNLRCVSRTFRNSRQEDAHEYMVNLLESMHKSCLPSGVPSESPGAYEKSLVHKIFGGRLRSEVKCTQCSYSSCKFDPFLDLSLEIVKADSLRKALAYFTAVEQLDGGQKQYQCQRCKEKVRALKQLTIHKAPYVLTIHLKRFGSHIAGQKIDKKVEFEPTLDLKPFVSDEHAVNLKYTLYGVLVHAGWSTHSGHYYCYVRTSSGMWHSLDDNKVSQVSEKTVLAQKAYMLFYVRNRNHMPKGSVNKLGQDNIFGNTTGKKLVPESSLISNGVTKNNLIEKNSSTSEAVSAKWGTNSANLQPTSAMDTSAHNSVPQAISTLQNCSTARNEIPELQNNSQVIGRKSFVLQEDRDSLPKGSRQTNSSLALSQGPMNSPVGNGNYYGKSSNISASRSDEVKSGAFIAQPNDTACDVLKSRKQEHKLRNESDISKNCDAVMTAQKNDELCETVKCIPEDDRKVTLSNRSIQTDGFIRKEDNSKAPLGNVTTNQNVRCSSNLQSQENSLPHEEEHLLNKLGSRSSFQKEACADDTIHKPLKVKPKKITKLPRRRLLLGRNHLFLTSLSLHMIKKSKKCNTRHVSLAGLDENFSISKDDQDASTSEPSRKAAVFKHSCTKRSRCELNKENNAQTMKNPNYCNGESSNATDVEGMDNGNNIILGELSKTCSISAKPSPYSRTRDAGDKVVSQHNFMNLLMRGLKETTVPRWDDQQPLQLGLNGSENSTDPSIGYLLDEWDEEYDRGKRKKLRKSQSVFGEKNPFQETANRKTRQKSTSMPESMRGGNQPFRI